MTGERAERRRCPTCGGSLSFGETTIPYILDGGMVIVVRNVPAEICGDCREAYTSGQVTDQIVQILQQAKRLHSEVTVVSYHEYEMA